MRFDTVIFDLGFTLLTFENFTLKRYFKTLDKGLEQMLKFLMTRGALTDSEKFRKKFKSLRNRNFQASLLNYREISTDETLNQTFESLNIPKLLPELTQKAVLVYHSTEGAFWKFRPNTEQVLQELKDEGLKMGILSNAPYHKGIISLLEINNLAPYFDAIVTSAQIGFCKPDKRTYEAVLLKLNSTPAQSIMIGDDLKNDIQGAQLLGLKTIHIKKKFTFPTNKTLNVVPDGVITDLSEILPIIREWNNS